MAKVSGLGVRLYAAGYDLSADVNVVDAIGYTQNMLDVTTLDLVPALTGPLARGDLATIERHLAALEADRSLHALYRALATELARLPLGHLPELTARLRALLDATLLDATPGAPAD